MKTKDILKVMQKRDPRCGTIEGNENLRLFGVELMPRQHCAILIE